MTMDEVRERLYALADELGCEELRELAEETRRRRTPRKVKPVSRPVTEELRESIREFSASHPGFSQAYIATVYGVNPGRVSEAINGFRE